MNRHDPPLMESPADGSPRPERAVACPRPAGALFPGGGPDIGGGHENALGAFACGHSADTAGEDSLPSFQSIALIAVF
jgi:hypothetical protein